MPDMAQFSDDISALWGPGHDGVLGPQPPAPAPPPGGTNHGGPDPVEVDADRVEALEEHIRRLAGSVEAHRAALDATLAEQLDRIRAESETRRAQLEATVARRLEEIGQQVAAAMARGAHGGPAPGPEADRLDVVERQLHEGMTRLHRTVDGFRTQAAGRSELEALKARFEAVASEQLARARAQAVAATDARLAPLMAQVEERLDAIARQVAEAAEAAGDTDRLKALEEQVQEDVARLSGSIEAQDGRLVSRSELRALWDSLRTALTSNLAQVRDSAVAAAAADLEARLGGVMAGMTDLAARVDSLAERPEPALEADLRVVREQVTALSGAVTDIHVDLSRLSREPIG